MTNSNLKLYNPLCVIEIAVHKRDLEESAYIACPEPFGHLADKWRVRLMGGIYAITSRGIVGLPLKLNFSC